MNKGRVRGSLSTSMVVAEGWSCRRLTPSSRLYGANGMRIGPDGRLYIAQVSGSQISAVDPDTGDVDAFSPMGSEIVAPDDLDFDDRGNVFVTEITEGRVSMRTPTGETRVIHGDLPCANPITVHQGRLFAGECRPDGRLFELDLSGGPPRLILDKVPMPNAMEVGPDGKLYFPVMGANAIWRVSLDGGEPETVATDLGVPDAVKFDAAGRIVSTQVASGEVLRIDPQSGHRDVLARLQPGLDNLVYLGDRLFVSNIAGHIDEVRPDGEVKSLIADGFNWPLGLSITDDGLLFSADGPFAYTLRDGQARELAWMLFSPGTPGYTRGAIWAGPGEVLATTANGQVFRCFLNEQRSELIADGFDRLYGIARTANGAALVAEAGRGRVISVTSGSTEVVADGLDEPLGLTLAPNGDCLVSEEHAGRVTRITAGGRRATVTDELERPQGICARGDDLFVVDSGAKEIIRIDLASGHRTTLAAGAPVGPPSGVVPKPLGPIGILSGPMGPFADVAVAPDGTVYFSADLEGSIMALQQI